MGQLTNDEETLVQEIKRLTLRENIDNISRTDAYFKYYKSHPDIQWSFLASMVSRNGGYNMCDLEGEYFSKIIDSSTRKQLFLTFERANWLIFHDIYPQLLIYHYSTRLNRPLFHLLKYFHISTFIEQEWVQYWQHKNRKRLTFALIINEQNVIQKPVIEHHFYKRKVFHSFLFQFEDMFHFSCVLFPTCTGELYGASVNGFRNLGKRIDLGKRLADILFNPSLYPAIYKFAEQTAHTGSRYDYERYFERKVYRKTPFLRTTFPVIKHNIHQKEDWSKKCKIPKSWLKEQVQHIHPIYLNEWYEKKQNQIMALTAIKELWK